MRTIKMICLTILIGLLPLSGFAVNQEQFIKEKMMGDLDIIKNTFDVKYAPADWKKIYADWDLDEQINLAKAKVLASENLTTKEFQRIVSEFFKSTRDYHVGVYFFSTESAFLPFRVQGVNDKYFIGWIDPQFSPPSSQTPSISTPWQIGDEVVMFDGKPIHEAIAEIKRSELGNPESATDQGMAELFLTKRVGMLGHRVPKDQIAIAIRHLGYTVPIEYVLTWDYRPEKIKSNVQINRLNQNLFFAHTSPKKRPLELSKRPIFQKQMVANFYEPFKAALNENHRVKGSKKIEDPFALEASEKESVIGAKKSFVPPLGKVIWQHPSDKHFHAYMYETENRQMIGYVRISDYMGFNDQSKEFLEIITLFQEKTAALVIDQVNNPGGIIFYMYGLLAMLSDHPLKLPTNRQTLIQADVSEALNMLDDLELIKFDENGNAKSDLGTELFGYPITQKLIHSLQGHFQFIVDEWNSGKYFTGSTFIYGIDELDPNPKGHYSKPILLLVNCLDFSCGDFFPAILQDNKRATVFGSRTAGAGGYVLSQTYPNRFGIANYSLTGSIAERADKNPIENLGVIPDLLYEITETDLQTDYSDYKNAVNQAVLELIPQRQLRKEQKPYREKPGTRS